MSNDKQSMKNNPQQNEDNNSKHQFSNSKPMTFSQQTEFLKTMNNNKENSVEWLIDELGEYFPWGIAGIELMVNKAKAMHKEECIHLLNTHNDIFDTSEEHYNKTFGGNNG